ncbi:fatty-acyl-CoA synthase [Amycolatopsis bartoniae]|uniref:Acyl-CoA synthetase n=1 Tax=Amycolatopsis bartoniae TaxID=941986 RepID=A0A8H9ITM9_9PSEU|nr:acyl-CoA synthetase [Amycolatopsis bartoniae]MBB2939651.1 fatty-acyl-CoA synthase [Amycolatopsis bartoniae]TVT06240.1 acyl-CoA synthetase [Amycolatopsis bartoniae]GHF36759.1 acyl-CoA synthetase [Amycolatopsis bartoniae]
MTARAVTPGTPFAGADPAQAAIIAEPSGTVVTYAELEARSNQAAHLFRERGLTQGDRVAILVENRAEFLELAWGAQRAGLYYVGVNTHLTPDEATYIVRDSGAQLVIASDTLADLATTALADPAPAPAGRLMLGNPSQGWENYESAASSQPDGPIPDQSEGDFMLYSSGTTGRPKGIQRPLPGGPIGTYPETAGRWLRELLGFTAGDVYLSPAPLYHAAPLGWSLSAHRSGGTVVVLERFDAELALAAIERHRVTHSQWVPTMFARLLKLPAEVREKYDLSSLRHAVHAAAPCPVEVKRAMIEWWGPILFEYYSSTEAIGATSITSEEWLRKPGSVGRPLLGRPFITDDDGRELPAGEVGTVWFAGAREFSYHGDPGKTAAIRDARGAATVGDAGYLDEDGYLFLSDRRTHLIISGGVNIYPREIEDVLLTHPAVADVAVLGLPDDEMGERVVAVVQPEDPAGPPSGAELMAFARTKLAGYKVPRDIRFTDELPRTPTGKMRKHELRQRLATADRDLPFLG